MDNNNVTANNSMSSFLDNYSKQEDAIKNSTAATEQQNRINTSLGFYEQSYNPTTAVEIRNQQHNASRAGKLASMIAEYGANNGVTVTGNDADIINKYIANLPENVRGRVAERFADYTHSTEYMEDSKDFALEMGWREKGFTDYIVDGAKGIWNTIWYGPEKLGRGIRKLEDMANASLDSENNQESLDIMNLANERFGFRAGLDGYLSDEDRADLQFEVDNNAASLDRQHNLANTAMDIAIGGLMSGIELSGLGLGITAGLGLGSELPITSDILERAGEKASDLGGAVNKAPVLKQYREALADEESKLEFDSFVGNMLIGAILNMGIKGGKVGLKKLTGGKNAEIKNFANNVTPEKVIEDFEKTKKKSSIQGKILADMNKMSDSAAKAFKDKYGVDYGEFLNQKGVIGGFKKTAIALRNNINRLYEEINKAVAQIKGDFYVKSKSMDLLIDDVVRYAKNTIEEETRPDVRKKINFISSKYYNGGELNAEEILYMLRYFEGNNKLAYKQSNVPEAIKTATNIDSNIRRQLSAIAESRNFGNMREINREISMSRAILDELGKDIVKDYGGIKFTDALLLFEPEKLLGASIKEFLNSDWFKSKVVKLINKLRGFKQDEQLTVDYDAINESNAEEYIKGKYNDAVGDGTPRLNEIYEGGVEATDNQNFAKMRDKDRPATKDLVIETNANDPYNVPKNVVKLETVKVLDELMSDISEKLDPNKSTQANIRDIPMDEWIEMTEKAEREAKAEKVNSKKTEKKTKKKKDLTKDKKNLFSD